MTDGISDQSTDHRETCRLFLELAADDLTRARRLRDHHIGLAHRYGLTNTEIGSKVGVSEARVRQILNALPREEG